MTKTERTAHAARMTALKAVAAATVATGTCPQCGAGLHRNLALTGWWQVQRLRRRALSEA